MSMHASRSVLRKLAQLGRSNEFTWRYLFNFKPTLYYQLRGHPLSGESRRAVSVLKRDGIAITSVKALLGTNSLFDELLAAVQRLEQEKEAQLESARRQANSYVAVESDAKPFSCQLLSEQKAWDREDIFFRFAVHKEILQVVNAYLNMFARLSYVDVWHTFATDRPARSSQLWHSDHDDLYYILKLFVYLSDVDEGAGPFTYAAGTHHFGNLRRRPAYLFREGQTTRSDDSQMAEIIPPARWVQALGEKGTIVFADTRGYHKGGLARKSDRLMYVCRFTAPSAMDGLEGISERIRNWSDLEDEQRYALGVY